MDLDGIEALLRGAVASWVARELPGEAAVAARAAEVAACAYARGASAGAACRAAHEYVDSWCNHPCRGRSARRSPAPVRTASQLAG